MRLTGRTEPVDELPVEEQARRAESLAYLEQRYRTLMAEAQAELDRAMAEGQTVRVAGFIRSCKGRKSRKKAS